MGQAGRDFVYKYELSIYFNFGSDQDSTVYLKADFDLGFFRFKTKTNVKVKIIINF